MSWGGLDWLGNVFDDWVLNVLDDGFLGVALGGWAGAGDGGIGGLLLLVALEVGLGSLWNAGDIVTADHVEGINLL